MSVFHIDLNSFYAHCAVVKSEGEYTFDTPLIVGGDPKSRHGIVLAATYPAKKTGIRAGMPLREANELCPEAVMVKADYHTYLDYSDRFMRILGNYSPLVMKYGIDEAYLDYRGSEHIFGSPEECADKIRKNIKSELGLTVSVGIGDNMVMAKMGSDYKKPDAVTFLNAQRWRELIWPLPIGNLMYVGRASQKRLNSIGIYTIRQLAEISPDILGRQFGIAGREMWQRANGIDSQRLNTTREQAKGIGNSQTLSGDASTREETLTALRYQVEKVAYRLREENMKAKLITVHMRYNDLSSESMQAQMPLSTDITNELYETARQLALKIYRDKPMRQIGVRLSKLSIENEQISIFDDERRMRGRELDRVSDKIKDKYGSAAVMKGSMLERTKRAQEEEVFFNPFPNVQLSKT